MHRARSPFSWPLAILPLLAPLHTLNAEPYIPGKALEADYKSFGADFIEYYCFDCHGDGMKKGDLSLDDLGPVDETNADLWKSIWAQVALQEMPPKKKDQPEALERIQFTDWVVHELEDHMEDKGGFHAHSSPYKGNFIDHQLLFGAPPKGIKLVPTASPKRIWRVTPLEHITRLNELINTEPVYNPRTPGLRTHGDAVSVNHGGELNLYFGVDRINSWSGGTVAYATAVKSVPAVLSVPHKHGFQNYAHFSAVNSAESIQILNKAKDILKYMAYGPLSLVKYPEQITDDPIAYDLFKPEGDDRGLPSSITYNTQSIRPDSPIQPLLASASSEINRDLLQQAIIYLFERLAFRPPSQAEIDHYLTVIDDAVENVGNEEGMIMGLSSLFLDRDALFRPELGQGGEPDEFGRVMLQDWELGLAVNHALSYLKPDSELKNAITSGRMKTKEDVRREVTRMLQDDSIRKPRVLQFFREFFDYTTAANICKDQEALNKTGLKLKPEEFRKKMINEIASTDRLIEEVLACDQDILKNLLTTQQVVVAPRNEALYGIKKSQPKSTKKSEKTKQKGQKAPKTNKDLLDIKDDSPEEAREKLQQFHLRKYGHPDGFHPAKYPALGGNQIYARVGYRSFGRQSLRPNRLLVLAPEGQRSGILTQPAWLVAHSDAMDNHAIHRGRWIRERLLGGGIPDVPITVDAQLPDEPDSTLRHKMRVTREKYCWTCHEKMDPLGLPFEQFNHIGMFRDQTKSPTDTSGAIIESGSETLDGSVNDALMLITKLAISEHVEQVFVRHAFRFWMGRNETLHDAPVLQEAHRAYRDSGGSMQALITSLVTSDAFLYRR